MLGSVVVCTPPQVRFGTISFGPNLDVQYAIIVIKEITSQQISTSVYFDHIRYLLQRFVGQCVKEPYFHIGGIHVASGDVRGIDIGTNSNLHTAKADCGRLITSQTMPICRLKKDTCCRHQNQQTQLPSHESYPLFPYLKDKACPEIHGVLVRLCLDAQRH